MNEDAIDEVYYAPSHSWLMVIRVLLIPSTFAIRDIRESPLPGSRTASGSAENRTNHCF